MIMIVVVLLICVGNVVFPIRKGKVDQPNVKSNWNPTPITPQKYFQSICGVEKLSVTGISEGFGSPWKAKEQNEVDSDLGAKNPKTNAFWHCFRCEKATSFVLEEADEIEVVLRGDSPLRWFIDVWKNPALALKLWPRKRLSKSLLWVLKRKVF